MTAPSLEYHRIGIRRPHPLPRGLDAVTHVLFGAWQRRAARYARLMRDAETVDKHNLSMQRMSDRMLREKLDAYRTRFQRGGTGREQHLPTALAAIREAAFRQVGLRPYPVQILGALAMHDGMLAEMATGEGKTLVAALVAVLAGWTHRPCHIVTVNDYLAQRDADWFRPLYRFCGLRVGCVTSTMEPVDRREAYAQQVTYTTSKELLADFLRDRLRLRRISDPQRRLIRALLAPRAAERETMVMRGLHAVIVDEADSVLVDEAVTPLIIAQRRENPVLRTACRAASVLADALVAGRDYTLETRYREVELTDAGMMAVESLAERLPPLWRGPGRRRELIEQAISARIFFLKDKNYVIQDGRVVIVDEFTGRIMPNRSWSEGLHQAIEAKEGIEITEPNETMARLSFQRFFRLFPHLCGMTGTATEAAGEFWRIYNLSVVTIPTHKPCIRRLEPEKVFHTADEKWRAIVDEIQNLHAQQRPVLVGTRNVAASERLAAQLDAAGLEYNLLNAVRHKEEARIIAEAGLHGKITIATNMAGRGTDIKLAGEVARIGGLHVIATERNESKRIDRQLFGRAARQGDPGSARGFVSLEDELFQRFTHAPVSRSLTALHARNPRQSYKSVLLAMDRAQRSAERLAFRMRRSVLGADTWLDESLSFSEDPGS